MIKAKYVGSGGFLNGIKRRDLTDEDWARLTDEQRTAVQESALYEVASAQKKPSKRQVSHE